MAKIKSFTSLEQAKVLAKILPHQSADMSFNVEKGYEVILHPYMTSPWIGVPCWSLAALLSILPNEISTGDRFIDKFQIVIRKYNSGNDATLYQIAYGNSRGLSGSWHDMINTGEKDNTVDACVAMIIKLNELNLL